MSISLVKIPDLLYMWKATDNKGGTSGLQLYPLTCDEHSVPLGQTPVYVYRLYETRTQQPVIKRRVKNARTVRSRK